MTVNKTNRVYMLLVQYVSTQQQVITRHYKLHKVYKEIQKTFLIGIEISVLECFVMLLYMYGYFIQFVLPDDDLS
jgi:hypothetical protein